MAEHNSCRYLQSYPNPCRVVQLETKAESIRLKRQRYIQVMESTTKALPRLSFLRQILDCTQESLLAKSRDQIVLVGASIDYQQDLVAA